MAYTKQTWNDEELADIALYDILTDEDVPINEDVKIELATDVVTPGSAFSAARMGHIEDGIEAAHIAVDDLTIRVNDHVDLFTTGGSSTAYTITTEGEADLTEGENYKVKFHTTAGASPTLNRDGKGALALKYYDDEGVKQTAGAENIIADMITEIVYDGVDYLILDPLAGTGGATFTVSAINPTTTNVTAVVNTRYNADISGLTANRNFVLPGGTVGDIIELNIKTGDDLYDLILIGDTGISINGGTAATASLHLYTLGQTVQLLATTTTNWQIVVYPIMCNDGQMINGKISPAVVSNDLVLSIKTLAGNDPSPSDPVWVGIAGKTRAIIAATSMTLADATSWFGAGSSFTAAQEIDYFAYAVWDSNSAVVAVSAARHAIGRTVNATDFSATTTNIKYLGNYSNFTVGDDCVVIGRFAATLSASAGHVWTVPAYTSANLIQTPIFETRPMVWLATTAAGTISAQTGTPTTVALSGALYKIVGGEVKFKGTVTVTAKGTASASMYIQAPFVTASNGYGQEVAVSGVALAISLAVVADTIAMRKYDSTTLWVDNYVINFFATANI